MEIRASLIGGLLHSAIATAAWAWVRYDYPTQVDNLAVLSAVYGLGALYGGLLGGSVADLTESHEGGLIGFLSGIAGGVFAAAWTTIIAVIDTGLAAERISGVSGLSLILASWYFPVQLIRQLGPGIVGGPLGGLFGAAARLRYAPRQPDLF